MIEAFITPRLVRWARERRNLSTDVVAKKVSVSASAIDAWEKGAARPTIRQAQQLAYRLNVPFGFLYLSTPPAETLPLPDLRTVAGAPPRKPTPDFLDTLHDVLRKQQWYHEYLRDQNAAPVPFIGRFNLGDDPKAIAADIRDTLGINDDLRRTCGTWEQFLTKFVSRAEEARVLVLRSSIVGSNTHRQLDVEEFRGFAISDDLAPLVFINSRDAKAAQIFTLAHELAHLWIGQSGISNPDYTQRSSQQHHVIDRHCDRIAAEVLVPVSDFTMRWTGFKTLDENLERLAARYRVSAFVILRRAYELGKVQSDEFRAKYQDLLERSKNKRAEGGGDFYATLLSRNSTVLTSALLAAAAEGRIPPREAAGLLNIRMTKLSDVESHLMLGRVGSA
jgi:Zn-dependent peptidase ImmA (M78 family)/DNA-binding XRE family transcriptional regulator